MPLSVRSHMALTLAGTRFAYEGERETRALTELGWTAPLFWRRVNWLLGQEDAERERPEVVRRLRRLREVRRRARGSSRPGLKCTEPTRSPLPALY